MEKRSMRSRRRLGPVASNRDRFWFAGLVLFLGLALLCCYLFIHALLPVFIALVLAYALDPAMRVLERRGWSRGWAALALLTALGALAAGLLAFLLPVLVREARELAASLPQDLGIAWAKLVELGARLGLDLPLRQDLLPMLKGQLEPLLLGQGAPGLGLLKQLFAGLGNAAAWSLALLLVPVFLFFFLRDLPAFRGALLDLVPPRLQPAARSVAGELDRVFSGYIRGQLTVALILGGIFATALSLLGVRYGLVIGLLAGFLNILPYVGQAVGLVLALVMVLVEGGHWSLLALIAGLFALVNFIEGTFITPQVVGDKVGLSAPQAMLALILGAEMAGLVGMVIAIPLAGSIKVLLTDLVKAYRGSHFYGA